MRRIVAAIALIVLTALPITNVFAQQPSSGQGLEISPPLIDQKVDPGQSIEVNIRVRNITGEVVVATGEISDFEAEGEEGLPRIITDEDAELSPYTFKPWVEEVPNLRLVPNEVKTATITIDVPEDASPGGHYGVVRFTASPEDLEGSGVALSASIGSLVLLNVSGDVVTTGAVEEFSVAKDDKKGSFFETGPLNIVARIKNTGNVHFAPTGEVSVTDTFGKQVAKLTVNENGGNVLPDSIRRFQQTLDNKNMFGRYKADLNLTYAENQTLNSSVTFWVIPYKPVLAVLFGLLVLILIIVLSVKRFKKHVVEEVHHDDEVKHGGPTPTGPVHPPGSVHHPETPDEQDNSSDSNPPPPPTIQ